MSEQEFQVKVLVGLAKMEERQESFSDRLAEHTEQDQRNFDALNDKVGRLVMADAIAKAAGVKWGALVSAAVVGVAEVIRRLLS